MAISEKKTVVTVVFDPAAVVPLTINGVKYLKAYQTPQTWLNELQDAVDFRQGQTLVVLGAILAIVVIFGSKT